MDDTPPRVALALRRASTLQKAGELDEAVEVLQELLEAGGSYPPATLCVLQNNLARVRQQQGRLSDAVMLYREALRNLPEGGLESFNVSHNLASALHMLMDKEHEAVAFARAALDGRSNLLGLAHPSTFNSWKLWLRTCAAADGVDAYSCHSHIQNVSGCLGPSHPLSVDMRAHVDTMSANDADLATMPDVTDAVVAVALADYALGTAGRPIAVGDAPQDRESTRCICRSLSTRGYAVLRLSSSDASNVHTLQTMTAKVLSDEEAMEGLRRAAETSARARGAADGGHVAEERHGKAASRQEPLMGGVLNIDITCVPEDGTARKQSSCGGSSSSDISASGGSPCDEGVGSSAELGADAIALVRAARSHIRVCQALCAAVLEVLVESLLLPRSLHPRSAHPSSGPPAAVQASAYGEAGGAYDDSLLSLFSYLATPRPSHSSTNSDEPSKAIAVPPHIDLGLLTLAPAASVPGLEVERRRCDVATSTGGIGGDGDEWEPIESLLQEDELLLFGGAALAHASSGALPALRHRVGLPASGRERVSMPFFLRPSLSVPLPPAGPATAASSSRSSGCGTGEMLSAGAFMHRAAEERRLMFKSPATCVHIPARGGWPPPCARDSS